MKCRRHFWYSVREYVYRSYKKEKLWRKDHAFENFLVIQRLVYWGREGCPAIFWQIHFWYRRDLGQKGLPHLIWQFPYVFCQKSCDNFRGGCSDLVCSQRISFDDTDCFRLCLSLENDRSMGGLSVDGNGSGGDGISYVSAL